MIIRGFPRWAVWLLNIAVIVALFAVFQSFKLAGWQFALGFGLGAVYLFVLFRWHYGWWPDFGMDGDDDKNAKLPRIER
jgi:uncharacterized membrane protein